MAGAPRVEGDRDAAIEALRAQRDWYHTIELAPGIVTPGYADLRSFARRVLPRQLCGRRCLDVGTFDGFWAFELESRGAEEVVAIDVASFDELDWPPNTREENLRAAEASDVELGRSFALAAGALHSSARWVHCPVYELEPERVGGAMDFALVSTVLQHLRDPIAALERVFATLKPGGELLLIESVSVPLTVAHPRRPLADFRPAFPERFNWWVPNYAAFRGWARTAGFRVGRRIPVAVFRPPHFAHRRDLLVGVRAQRPPES